MKEVIQLNLTEEEAIILQAVAAVGIEVHLKNATGLEESIRFMEAFINEWPEASKSLANKMTALVKASKEIIEAIK